MKFIPQKSYYKSARLLQIGADLLQIGAAIINWGTYYKSLYKQLLPFPKISVKLKKVYGELMSTCVIAML